MSLGNIHDSISHTITGFSVVYLPKQNKVKGQGQKVFDILREGILKASGITCIIIPNTILYFSDIMLYTSREQL